jgi:hypothetical protein
VTIEKRGKEEIQERLLHLLGRQNAVVHVPKEIKWKFGVETYMRKEHIKEYDPVIILLLFVDG